MSGQTAITGRALTAVPQRGEYDVIAYTHLADRIAHRLDHPSAFMP
jgi:hypothetical protein